MQFGNGAADPRYLVAQGAETIPSQNYHDVLVVYHFGKRLRENAPGWSALGLLAGVKLQVGIKNVFNALPPFDVYYDASNYFTSPYGDTRGRSYWVSVIKQF
jgi:outer membrane receptor protein involved in Fe transport